MLLLGHSAVLRSNYDFPPSEELYGASASCILGESPAIGLIHNDPEAACLRFNAAGLDRIVLIDDLLAHCEYGAAYDLALYLASSPDVFQTRNASPGRLQRAVGRVVLLRLLASLAAIQGGLYHRARASLLRVGQLIKPLDDAGSAASLMKANWLLLWGRLAQVQSLPRRALEYFDQAEAVFADTPEGVPSGLELLRRRSQLRLPETGLKLIATPPTDPEQLSKNIFGKLEPHYRHYLAGRAALARKDWDVAYQQFETSREKLLCVRHVHLTDPIRLGYLNVGIARARIGKGFALFGRAREIEAGLKQLLEARSIFRQRRFTPGEYVAHRYYCLAKLQAGCDEDTSLQLLKGVHTIGQSTGVLRFELESGLDYAIALYKYGRPNAAHAVMRHARALDEDAFSAELGPSLLVANIRAFLSQTTKALDNAVEPLEQWGISSYAERERDFVASAADDSHLVSAYGPPGCGRRIFLERVSEARTSTTDLAVIIGVGRPVEEIEAEIHECIDTGASIVLYDLNDWLRGAQERVLRLITTSPQHIPRVYATLTRALDDARIGSQLAPRLAALLEKGTWRIDPLASRPEDTLLLARGFMIRSLSRQEWSKSVARNLIFSGNAARYLKHRYSHIGDLYRAMRFLAHRLRVQYDVLHEVDGYVKVPIETVERYLTRSSEVSNSVSTNSQQEPTNTRLGPEVKKADAVTVQDLARRFEGRLSDVAKAAGVPRSTLIRAWTQEGVMDVWYGAKGRKARRTKSTKAVSESD